MITKRNKALIYILLSLLVTNCTAIQINTSTPSINAPTNAVATVPPRIPSPSQTQLSPILPLTTTPIFVSSPTLPLTPTPININLSETCITTMTRSSPVPEGVIVKAGLEGVSLTDLNTYKQIFLGKTKGVWAVSSNHKMVALINTAHVLIIADANGNILKSLPVPLEWRGVIQWADDQTLLIEKFDSEDYSNPPAATVKFNLTTQEQEEFLPIYPEMETALVGGTPNWGTNSSTVAVFDAAFSRVAYLAYDDKHDDPLLILWNMQEQGEILRLHGSDFDNGGGPKWLRDGSGMITGITPVFTGWNGTDYFPNLLDDLPYLGGYELALISRDGQINRLTYLTTRFKAGEEGIALSPDDRQIALWLNLNYGYRQTRKETTRQLAILEIETKEITNLCLTGGDFPYPPVWSPDGKYLTISLWYDNQSMTDVILVDLQNLTAFEIAHEGIVTGWMVAP